MLSTIEPKELKKQLNMKPNKIHLENAKIMCEYLGDICDNVKDKMVELISQGLAEAETGGWNKGYQTRVKEEDNDFKLARQCCDFQNGMKKCQKLK